MAIDRYISGDSHVLEPANLWVERMDKTFRDQAPRVVHSTTLSVRQIDPLLPC